MGCLTSRHVQNQNPPVVAVPMITAAEGEARVQEEEQRESMIERRFEAKEAARKARLRERKSKREFRDPRGQKAVIDEPEEIELPNNNFELNVVDETAANVHPSVGSSSEFKNSS